MEGKDGWKEGWLDGPIDGWIDIDWVTVIT